jgi:membrane fusion protein, multidrug efflux system
LSRDLRKTGRIVALSLGALALVLLVIALAEVDWHPRTDDATVRANTVEFAPEVEGRVVRLLVNDNQLVHKGDLLFVIDPRPYEYALQQAKAEQATLEGELDDERRHIATERSAVGAADASVMQSESGVAAAQAGYLAAKAAVERTEATRAAAEAQLRLAQNDYDRIAPLLAKHYVTVEQVDHTRTALQVASEAFHEASSQLLQEQAQETLALATRQSATAGAEGTRWKLGEARHAVDNLVTLTAARPDRAARVLRAELNLQWCYVRSPFDGYVTNLNISEGEYAHVGTPIFTLVDTGRWWVLANYRESRLKHIRPGMSVEVFLMERPDRRFHGVVESIGRGVFPEDGAVAGGLPDVDRTLNWVHLSARFPVRIRVTDPDPQLFRIGATAITIVR